MKKITMIAFAILLLAGCQKESTLENGIQSEEPSKTNSSNQSAKVARPFSGNIHLAPDPNATPVSCSGVFPVSGQNFIYGECHTWDFSKAVALLLPKPAISRTWQPFVSRLLSMEFGLPQKEINYLARILSISLVILLPAVPPEHLQEAASSPVVQEDSREQQDIWFTLMVLILLMALPPGLCQAKLLIDSLPPFYQLPNTPANCSLPLLK